MRNAALLCLVLLTLPLAADDYVLPSFAVTMPGGEGVAWSSEAYVTNTSDEEAEVIVGPFLPGLRSDTPPCLPIVPPFIRVPPRSTVLWRTIELAGGAGCPEFAAGGMLFHSDRPVRITSRMVRHSYEKGELSSPLSGFGQEIDAINLLDLPKGERKMILPAVGWHPNACGASRLDTNAFFTNPTSTPVRIELDAAAGDEQLMVDGVIVDAPYVLEVGPMSQRVIRLAGPGAPMLPVCLEPLISSFTFTASGPVAAIASIIDRTTGDARTAAAIPVE